MPIVFPPPTFIRGPAAPQADASSPLATQIRCGTNAYLRSGDASGLRFTLPRGAVPCVGSVGPAARYDKWTAIYDLSAHTVYLPDGSTLEAHSGLGARRDDPRSVGERMRGATPPGLYALVPREAPFHGVHALRLLPIGGRAPFGRSGLLAHPYMLGPDGDSNGCVSFQNYDAFLRAFENGQVKRLAVVVRR
jgi:hypothetical protein